MNLLTPELHERLLINGRERDVDHVPVVKFFNPFGQGVWLATELDADGVTLFGLADLGCPELESIRLPFGMGIERDILFQTDAPISAWAETARQVGSIRGAERVLCTGRRSDDAYNSNPVDTKNRNA